MGKFPPLQRGQRPPGHDGGSARMGESGDH